MMIVWLEQYILFKENEMENIPQANWIPRRASTSDWNELLQHVISQNPQISRRKLSEELHRIYKKVLITIKQPRNLKMLCDNFLCY